MTKTDLLESAVAIVSGVTAAVCYILLFIAMSAPVAETVIRLQS